MRKIKLEWDPIKGEDAVLIVNGKDIEFLSALNGEKVYISRTGLTGKAYVNVQDGSGIIRGRRIHGNNFQWDNSPFFNIWEGLFILFFGNTFYVAEVNSRSQIQCAVRMAAGLEEVKKKEFLVPYNTWDKGNREVVESHLHFNVVWVCDPYYGPKPSFSSLTKQFVRETEDWISEESELLTSFVGYEVRRMGETALLMKDGLLIAADNDGDIETLLSEVSQFIGVWDGKGIYAIPDRKDLFILWVEDDEVWQSYSRLPGWTTIKESDLKEIGKKISPYTFLKKEERE